ncbi:hypothetical protein HPB47_010243, partial [Ixodes persulcatus]
RRRAFYLCFRPRHRSDRGLKLDASSVLPTSADRSGVLSLLKRVAKATLQQEQHSSEFAKRLARSVAAYGTTFGLFLGGSSFSSSDGTPLPLLSDVVMAKLSGRERNRRTPKNPQTKVAAVATTLYTSFV